MASARGVSKAIYRGETRRRFEKIGIRAMENAEVYFHDPHTLSVDGVLMTSDKFLIATGSSPLVPGIQGIDAVRVLTNETVFSLEKLPGSMIILGAGPIGAEMAMALNRLGVQVTLVEMSRSILPREDREMSDLLADIMKRDGVKLVTGVVAAGVSGGEKKSLICRAQGRERRIRADSLLIAAGRAPNTSGLDLEAAGVVYSKKGISVNGYLQTSAKNIFAAGDVVGPYQFSHVANYQAIAATSNAFLPFRRKVSYEHVPWCIFTDPELARSGLTEQEARERFGRSVRVYRVPYAGLDRAAADRAPSGLAKIICAASGKILGIHILGERAGELMHEAHGAKSLGIPLYRLNSVIHAYPTYNDAIRQASREAYIDRIRRNVFVRLIQSFRKGK